ncbi:MAG TPA: flavin reductase family protein [Thermodesulfobacteriota bacterium]|nr:flavin reductase family protein [Thermodesulfobacteriota bacterium]
MSKQEGASVAGIFWSLAPVVAITSSWQGKVNAQIAVTVITASIVHDVPRLIVGIWKGNFTHEFIINSRAFAVHLLNKGQLQLVRNFGFYTGREREKLKKIRYKLGVTGSPILEEAHSYADCRVINAMDGGDMTGFLVDVVDGGIITGGEWMTLDYFYYAAPPEWIAEYGEKLTRSVAFSLERIHKISYDPWSP